MILAAVGDGLYNFFLFLHITTFALAFVPVVAHPLMAGQLRRASTESQARFAAVVVQMSRAIYAPSLILTGLFGIILILLSDDTWEFSQSWISAAFLVWFVMNGVLHAMVIPGERTVASGDASGQQRADIGNAILTVLFLVMVYLMISKPGLS